MLLQEFIHLTGVHDQFIAQYKVVLLNKLATIERIN